MEKTLLYRYLKAIKHVENDIASHIKHDSKLISFWYQEDGYVLVVENDKVYWGNDDLTDFNNERLTFSKLYKKLIALNEAGDDFYGMTYVLDKLS